MHVVVSGAPQSYQRTRIAKIPRPNGDVSLRPFTPKETREWKGIAKEAMRGALARATGSESPPWAADVPLDVRIEAVFACPTGEYRKREPRPRRWSTRATADADNVAKAVLDAGNGVLWIDDRQVASLLVRKIIGAQEEPPRVEVTVLPIGVEP